MAMVDIDFNLVQVDVESFRKKRKRQRPACVRCHEKKIKCDLGQKAHVGPCRHCISSQAACISHVDGRTRESLYPSHEPVFDGLNDAPSILHAGADDALELGTGHALSTDAIAVAVAHKDGRQSTVDNVYPCYDDTQLPLPSLSVVGSYISSNDGSWVPMDPSFQTTPSTSETTPDSATTDMVELPRFEAYTIDNLGSFAPSFKSHNRQDRGRSNGYPTAPFCVDMSARPSIDIEKLFLTLDNADMAYLEAKGAFDLPPRSLQKEMIEAYFTNIHCAMPVINRAQFLDDFYGNRSQSRLLLFAIFTAGCRACRNPLLLDHTGSVRSSGLRFYKITRALLDTGYERDRLTRIQALLLIVPWWDKKDDGGRNMRACAVDAINTAQSMGLHRWDQYPRSNPPLLSLWKRVWWTCFFRDVGVATSHGLPPMLAVSDFDVEPLTPQDFEIEHSMLTSLASDMQQTYRYSSCEIAFMIESVKLMEMQHHIQIEHFVRPRLRRQMTGSIRQREMRRDTNSATALQQSSSDTCTYNDYDLRTWLDRIPDVVQYDFDDVQGHRFLPAVLHIFYFTAIMLRFREKSVSAITGSNAAAERRYSQARGIAAATAVSKIMRNARAHGHILRFSGQLTNTLFNCLIFFLIESKSLNPEVRRDARNKYSSCLNMLYDFSQLWISASLIHRLFEALQAHMILEESRGGDDHHSPTSVQDVERAPLFPGLVISSDMTVEYMKRLLQGDATQTAQTTPSQQSTGLETATGVPFADPIPDAMWLEDGFGNLGFVGGGLPDTLNVDDWLGFLNLQQEIVSQKAIP